MIIKNFERLATSSLRRQALLIAEAAFEAINTKKVIERNFVYNSKKQILKVQGKKFILPDYKNIVCAGFGKVSIEAVKEIQSILKDKITKGLVIGLEGEGKTGKIIYRHGSHPHPSSANIKATKELVEMVQECGEDDLVITVVSGGGSALLCDPYEVDLMGLKKIFESLTSQGATIRELNTVRKHLSRVKGGQLAKIIYPASCISLIFSDIPGDDISMVASGPTVFDSTSAADAKQILQKYKILENCQMPSCQLIETPKEEKYFKKVSNILFVSAKQALSAMNEKAEDLGFKVKVFSGSFEGEAKKLGGEIVRKTNKGECLLGTGESTVRILGKGKGGRNLEMALAGMFEIKERQVLLCLASDGHDNTEVAGAIADQFTFTKAKSLKLDSKKYLRENDSFNFFEEVDDAVITGFTGSNISDFFICLKN